MADLTITATGVSPVKVIEQHTVPAHEAVDAGEAIYLVAATGKAGLADENVATPVNNPLGISIKTANQANIEMTFLTKGLVDLGDALDGMDYGETVWLSATAGKLADADPGNSIVVGVVWPVFGATTADKVLRIDL